MSSIEEKARHEAQTAMRKAYAPYSEFRVGASLVTESDDIFSGCNIENCSYGLTVCAERVALFKAVSEGCRKFKLLVLTSDSDKAIVPCGACLQVLAEFCDDLKIIVYNGDMIGRTSLAELLPHRFRL
ncbi:MAG: cytidine deaminase [candidate division Zixibacteria bacterium]|nr:cytidine deaminase [candidate division Zixibacteria bacterium]